MNATILFLLWLYLTCLAFFSLIFGYDVQENCYLVVSALFEDFLCLTENRQFLLIKCSSKVLLLSSRS